MKGKSKIDSFARWLKAIRKRLKINQDDFCKRMNISKTNLSKVENGKSKPGYGFFFNIVKEFNINLHYLFFGEGPMFNTGEQDNKDLSPFYPGHNDYDDENIREFLYRFFNSKYLQYRIMSEYIKIYAESSNLIDDEVKKKESREKK